MKPTLLSLALACLLAVAAPPRAGAAQPPLDYIYSADTLVERADEFACQLALSGQIAPDEGFLLSSDTFAGKTGGYGVALSLRLRRQQGGQVIDVPVTGLRIEAGGVSTAGFARWELSTPGGLGLVSRNDPDVFGSWGAALAGGPFTVTIERGDGRGAVSVAMPPLPEDLAQRHRRCLERLEARAG